uniref:Uncharacterized protein n=1 Tax=Arundo donax TaxID=35708 RepID=A0A0A9DKD3_ARUDO
MTPTSTQAGNNPDSLRPPPRRRGIQVPQAGCPWTRPVSGLPCRIDAAPVTLADLLCLLHGSPFAALLISIYLTGSDLMLVRVPSSGEVVTVMLRERGSTRWDAQVGEATTSG